jgi:hypothetical protein
MVNPISFGPSGINSQADFSPLAQLGNIYQKAQQDQANKAAFAQYQQTGDPSALLASGDMNLARLGIEARNHLDTLRQQGIENTRADINTGINQTNAGINQARAKREAADWEKDIDQFVPNPKFGQPGEPQYIDQRAAATAASGNPAKPIPFETLGGTKFLVPQPGGGYKAVDPSELLQGGGAQPQQQPQQQPQPQTQQQPQPQPAVQKPDTETIDETTGRREGYLKSLDPQVQDYLKKVADYEIDPRTSSIKGGKREMLLSAVAKYDPTYNQNEFGTRAKAMKDFSTGQQGNSIRSFDVAIDHLDTLKKYTEALGSGNSRLVNEYRNKWLEATGSELPTNVQAVAPIVGAEVSKAIIGSNNALADREELRKPLQTANSVPQIMGAISAYQDLMAGQLKGLKKQYEDTTGKKNFDTRIRENTRNVLTRGGGGGGDARPDPLGIR